MSDTRDLHGDSGGGWIGVDLDGTLARYDGWKGSTHIGEPLAPMVNRVFGWLEEGKEVRIMTARVAPGKPDAAVCRGAIRRWCAEVFGRELPITHEKDHRMIELWDDRVVQVIPNTGMALRDLASSFCPRCGAPIHE